MLSALDKLLLSSDDIVAPRDGAAIVRRVSRVVWPNAITHQENYAECFCQISHQRTIAAILTGANYAICAVENCGTIAIYPGRRPVVVGVSHCPKIVAIT